MVPVRDVLVDGTNREIPLERFFDWFWPENHWFRRNELVPIMVPNPIFNFPPMSYNRTMRSSDPIPEGPLQFFDAPPEPRPGRGGGPGVSAAADRIVAELQQHPGKWVPVRPGYRSKWGGTPFVMRGCKVSTIANDDGTFDVWACWPGDPQDCAQPVD